MEGLASIPKLDPQKDHPLKGVQAAARVRADLVRIQFATNEVWNMNKSYSLEPVGIKN